ncbi:plasmid recombination protein [Staphylococcus epidermidis]|uniref:plasmid recombination protein n=1 Tax=Staphylococcus epidermidis TaxID=1282 RepID=UPI002094D331|nr:plasmid recombination protein [Staphylococcus epidermidis]MCO6264284.1 plasmid recombination protein [Staphylococcus epidermidis]
MKLAWNAQKNKMSDVKGKEMEQENAVSAKVQMDKIVPHMHLYFIPLNRRTVNEIHDELTDYLCQHSFDVERGQTKK